jgi:uncharacterized membrane protein YedE/YeeE
VSRSLRWWPVVVGLVFGFQLTASGLGNYTTIHQGLLLQDPYIYLMLGSALAVGVTGLALLRRRGRTWTGGQLTLPRARFERRHVYGGVVFGLGFGVGATCPGITIAMTSTGGLYGLVVLVGLLGGLALRGAVERRQRRPLTTEPMTAAPVGVPAAR